MLPQHAAPTSPATTSQRKESCLEVERLFAKERFKEAVKQATLCYNEESIPENHRLLERAYCLRARQLIEFGMSSSAVEVARHLIEFGVTGGGHVDEIVRLFVDLGLRDEAFGIQERLGEPDNKSRLVAMAADRAVLHPESCGEGSSEFAADVKLVRESLSRLQARDEPGALLQLRDLARSSVLSEWKFFVRGLAAFYRGDSAEMTANWDRLDPERKAYRIARRLRDFTALDGGVEADERIHALEKLAFREPILERLRELNTELASQDWDKIFARVGSLRQSLRRIDPKLAERLTLALAGTVIREAPGFVTTDARRILNGFIRAAEPTAMDPRWNRFWAIALAGCDRMGPTSSLDHWEKYLEDLKTIPVLGDSERALAQAMVWNRIAKATHAGAAELDDDEAGPFGLPISVRPRSEPNAMEVLAARKRVVDCLEKSLALAPLYRPTYELLVDVYRGCDTVDSFVPAAQRLLEKFPDDLETLTILAEHFTKTDDPAAALPLVVKARELKPLDDSLRELEWTVRVNLARSHALGKRWDQGREQFAAALKLVPDSKSNFHYLAQQVMFESKAGNRELSERYLEQARACLNEPTPLWLALAIESIRYRMTKATKDGYARLWESDLRLKRNGETGGLMAALLDGLWKRGVEYAGRATHIKKVAAYVGPGSRLKYRQIDIENICEFLGNTNQAPATIEKLVAVGLKQHPKSALLNLRAGLLDTTKSVFGGGGFSARRYFDTALKLAEASADPKEIALVAPIKKALTLLNEADRMPFGLPSFGGSPGFPFGGFQDFFEDWDDEDDDFDEGDCEPRPARHARPAPRARKSNSRKRR